ncbi:MAG TPA: 3'-5' exonuclease [Kineosporiaceae bacterium]|nr:3'-5' exonuclease [Kineosporiaceae bacterium]
MSPSTQAGLEEERRLFYVALTRARKQLTIYVPLRYHHRPRGRDGLHSYAQPSRFLCPSVRRHLDTVYAGHLEIAPATHCDRVRLGRPRCTVGLSSGRVPSCVPRRLRLISAS